MKLRQIFYGAAFGFILSRSGATRFDAIHDMFALKDFHLVGVMGTAIVVTMVGFWIARRIALRSAQGEALAIQPKPMHPGVPVGGILFGIGWGLTGTCPGTALAQVGEGTMLGAVTVVGMLAGMRFQAIVARFRSSRASASQARSAGAPAS